MCSVKMVFLDFSQNSQESTCARVFFLAKVFSCDFCEIFKNNFYTEHFWATASELRHPLMIVTLFMAQVNNFEYIQK